MWFDRLPIVVSLTGAERAGLILFLLFLQTSRRLYECVAVSIFSEQRIRLFSYLVGHYFYIAVPAIVFLQSVSVTPRESSADSAGDGLGVAPVLAVFTFVVCWVEQHRILQLFARLRTAPTCKLLSSDPC
jgi:hypothetical protein